MNKFPGEQFGFDAHFAVLSAAVFFNFLLAILNANIFSVSSLGVVLVQLSVTVSAVLVAYFSRPIVPFGFYFSIFILVLVYISVSLLRGYLDPAALYNILVAPAFILLGASYKRNHVQVLWKIGFVVTLVALLEALFPSFYIVGVNPLSYYSSTRAWVADQEGIEADEGLYMGADRSGGGVFGLADHRVASVFLEPISLGYFAVICCLGVFYGDVSKREKATLFVFACLLTLLSDTRTSFLAVVLIAFFSNVIRNLPIGLVVGAPVFALGISWIAYEVARYLSLGELSYRLSITFDMLGALSFLDVIFGGFNPVRAGDSGILLLISSVGGVGAIAYFAIASGVALVRGRLSGYSFMLSLCLVIFSMFGGAIFSIKASALFGFITGVMCRKSVILSMSSGVGGKYG